jgi:RHS repeat-associated protein
MEKFFFTIFILLAINGFSQEYSYDAKGNMTGDANKEIARIHYNIFNLPDTIVYKDGRTIIYAYTALGQKLTQRVVASNGTLLQKQDYIDDFQYRNDTLREIQHCEGRVVSNKTSTWAYQYYLTDHLGNVRSTITSEPDTIEFLATMETESAAREQIIFDELEKNRVNFVTANHTTRGNEVAQVRRDKESAAVSMDLAVQYGDIIYLQVHAYYEGPPRTKDPASSLSTILLPIVLAAFNGAPMVGESQRAMLSIDNITGGLTAPSEDKSVPKAHLNYQLFDKEYNAVDGGFAAVTEQASFKGELLALGPIKTQRSGYLYVYLSNTSEENIPVYFDDLKITHVLTPVIQEDSYDPFGLTLTEQHVERFGVEPNNHLFNGKELQDEFALNLYDYSARMYDPALARWHVPDLLTEKYPEVTPYVYAMNNPLTLIDPDGRDVVFHQAGTDKGRFEKLTSVVNVLRKTNEGKKILSKAENNKDITVYVSGSHNIKNGNSTGLTTSLMKAGKLFESEKEKKSAPVGEIAGPDKDDMKIFTGLDLITDIQKNSDVYFVLIDVDQFDEKSMANTLGHEIEAHVNISQELAPKVKSNGKVDVKVGGKIKELGPDDAQHHTFGSAKVDSNGVVIIIHKGTSAERLKKQIEQLKIKPEK